MKKHTKIVMTFYGYGEQDFIPCLMCGTKACDVHHIDRRGMGGSKNKDYIENLATLCRKCHNLAESNKDFNKKVKENTKNNIKLKRRK